MIITDGDYRYEIRHAGDLIAIEQARLSGDTLTATRRSADGFSRHEVEALLDAEGRVRHLSLRYSSTLFKRSAVYDAVEETLRGSVSALAGRNEIVVKLGRFREVEVADLTIFRMLLLMHARQRGQARWTGRVAVIDGNTLVAASFKQNCGQRDAVGRMWVYEPRMGDSEEIELDQAGRILRRRDNRGTETTLIEFKAVA
jgi:hypothetical protein